MLVGRLYNCLRTRDASRADTIANNCYDSFLSTSESWHNTPLIVLTVNECRQYNMILIVITLEEYKVLLVNYYIVS